MKVQEFMTILAKEANIANMTVETNDGRRISATFEHGIAGTMAPSIPSDPSKANGNGVSKDGTRGGGSDQKKDKVDGNENNSALTSPTRDIAATMAMMGAEKTVLAPTLPAQTLAAHASQQWAINYQNKHVAVTYSSIGAEDPPSVQSWNDYNTTETSALPPKKRAAKQEDGASESDWDPMTTLADAATVVQQEHMQVPQGVVGITGTQVASAITTGGNVPTEALKKKPCKRKSRKIIPDVKEYVEFIQKDVLFGRGGRSNHHPGNKIYRDIVTAQQNHYRGCDKNEKTKVAQGIVDHIQNKVGGRFLEMDRVAKRWFLVPNVVARRKVGQALRENNTEEARAAKRAKYQGRLNNKKKNLVTTEVGNGTVPMVTVNIANNVNGTLPLAAVNNANINTGTLPLVGVSASANNIVYPIAAATGAYTNTFPVNDSENTSVEV